MSMPAPFDPNKYPREFVTVYPGKLLEKEKELVEKYFADNEAIRRRGEIDAEALAKGDLPQDTPGLGASFVATDEMIRYNAYKYDPENPVYNDEAYARALGYEGLPALPTFSANDDVFMIPYPPQARDLMTVMNLNHSETFYKPVYAGDTLYMVSNSRDVLDMTPPEGSIYRSNAIRSAGSVYNQKGEKVCDVVFRVCECNKNYVNRPAELDAMGAWDTAEWTDRPQHCYTDADWEFIKGVWAAEKRQGEKPLYWEDVSVGDEPAWTLDGPIIESVEPIFPYGMGAAGSRASLKKEIMDPEIFKTMTRDADGIYRLPDYEAMVPDVPAGPHKLHGGLPQEVYETLPKRRGITNYMGRDIALRHINNYMGDHGWLHSIRWNIMSPQCMRQHGIDLPVNPDAVAFSDFIPENKKKRYVHAVVGDIYLTKSRVYDKYVKNGKHYIELAWWCETIEGYVSEEGQATIQLPSKA